MLIDSLITKGLHHIHHGDIPLGISFFEEALQLDPRNPTIHMYLATAYEQVEQYDNANTHFLKAIALTPTDRVLLNRVNTFRLQHADALISASPRPRLVLISENPFPEALEFWQASADIFWVPPDSTMANSWTGIAAHMATYLPEGWIPDYIVMAPIETSCVPHDLHLCPYPCVGLVAKVHPFAQKLMYDLPRLDAVITTAREHQALCRQWLTATQHRNVFYTPFSPLAPVPTQSATAWNERAYDVLTVLPRTAPTTLGSSSPFYSSFLKNLAKIPHHMRIHILYEDSPKLAEAIGQARIFLPYPHLEDKNFVPPLCSAAIQHKTLIFLCDTSNEQEPLPHISYRLDSLNAQLSRYLNDATLSQTMLSQATRLSQTQWSLPKIFSHILSFLKQHKITRRAIAPIDPAQSRLSQLIACTYTPLHHANQLHLLQEHYLEQAAQDAQNPALLNNLATTCGALALAEPLHKSEQQQQAFALFAQLLEHSPNYAPALFNKAMLTELLTHSCDVPSWQKCAKLLQERHVDEHFGNTTLLFLPKTSTPWLLTLWGFVPQHSNTTLEELAIVAYRDVYSYAAHHALGQQALQRHHYREAAQHFQMALQAAPQDADLWLKRALALLKLNLIPEARHCAHQALFANPLHHSAELLLQTTAEAWDDIPALSSLLQSVVTH